MAIVNQRKFLEAGIGPGAAAASARSCWSVQQVCWPGFSESGRPGVGLFDSVAICDLMIRGE